MTICEVHAHGPHGESAAEAGEFRVEEGTRRLLNRIAVAFAIVTTALLVVVRPTGGERPDLTEAGFGGYFYDARVVALEEVRCPGEGAADIRCAEATFELLGGPDEGERVRQQLFDLDSMVELSVGDVVVLRHDPRSPGEFAYQFTGDRQRRPTLVLLAAVFALAVVLLGRVRGLASLVGLGVSLGVLVWFVLPAIIDGRSPVLVAVAGSAVIAYVTLYLAHGFGPMTTVALLGTLASLFLTLVLGVFFVDRAAFSGLSSEDSFYLQVGGAEIDFKGLILAGVVIGALGAIDDMTVTQASAVWQLHAANPRLGRLGLWRAGMRIGRDHVASTVNTLALAYAGASLPLLLLFVLSRQPLGVVLNTEIVAVEVVRTLVGSVGLVAAVPLTTWLAAEVAVRSETAAERRARRRSRRSRSTGEGLPAEDGV
ncbi:MAG: membrane protein [Acidimicrobiales bacterium]|nr:MAG: membrane protein [Acidimicrobiales bacterium]